MSRNEDIIQSFTSRLLISILLLFFLHFFYISDLISQSIQPTFDRITKKDGLAQSSIINIIQDHYGFMWFATYDGLSKYDGYKFTNYKYNESDTNSLSHNGLYLLVEDNKGFIWVVNIGNSGLDKYYPEKDRFIRYYHDPLDPKSLSSNDIAYLFQDNKSDIWICGGKVLNLLTSENNNLNNKVAFQKFYAPEIASDLNFIYQNKEGQLLIFSNYLLLFNKETQSIENTGVKLVDTRIISIVELKNGDILLGTNQSGILKLAFNKINKTYIKVDAGKINLTPKNRNTLIQDSSGNLWITTESNGIFEYIPEKDEFRNYLHDINDISTISDNTTYSLFIDNTEVLWIGTFSQGICKYDLYQKKFIHYKSIPGNTKSLSGNVISSISSIDPGELWVGLDIGGGINRIKFNNNKDPEIKYYLNNPKNPNSIGGNSILCLIQRRNGEIWAGSAGGAISRFKPEAFESKQNANVKRYNLPEWTFSIFEDSDHVLWGGTWEYGLWRYDDKTDKFTIFQNRENDPNSLCDNIIWAIGEDIYNNIWIGGHGKGLSILPRADKYKDDPSFVNFEHIKNDTLSLNQNTINAFCNDRNGNIWIGTGGGLNMVDISQNDLKRLQPGSKIYFRNYNKINSLLSESIVGIIEDDNGNLWLSTTNGILKFNKGNDSIIRYDENDGLQSDEFWHNSYFKDKNGTIYFGGQNGFNAFNPDEIRVNPFKPKVIITDLKISNQSVKVDEEINNQIILTKPIYLANEIALEPRNNVFTLEFAALHYAKPEKNKYTCKLEGFDKSWNYIENNNSVTYTNLDPGLYTFRLKASNHDNIWSTEETTLRIRIIPPWWKTWLFKISSIVFIILLVYLLFRYRLHMLRSQKKILQETVEERTAELSEANAMLEERQEEISTQNEELSIHRNNLEKLVAERTAELEKSKVKAEEADRLKSAFLANMSHEIRTPMNAIIGFSNLLNEKDISEEDRNYFIQMINSNGQSLMVLIDDIIDISMIESNQLTLSAEYFDATEIFKEVESYFLLNHEKRLKIEFVNKNEDSLYLNTDPVRLRQILNNLLYNAVKYTDNGYIRFGYKISPEELTFFVSDSGIGINNEHIQQIFNPFYKIEENSLKVYRGAGIGLAICKKLLNMMNGRIWVESEPKKGSTFWFTLPSAIQTTTIESKESKIIDNISLENYHIVIAEDEPANYYLIDSLLKLKSENKFWATDGKKAVEYILNFPDKKRIIVLMDIKMPVMSGNEALKEIKKINNSIPVIAITAFALKSDKEKILKEGYNAYLSKPVQKEALISILSEFIE